MRTRENRVVICLTDEELKSLNNKVEQSGLNRAEYCRRILSGRQVTEFSADVSMLIQELRSIGRKMDQIKQECSQADTARLQTVLSDLQRLSKLIVASYSPKN